MCQWPVPRACGVPLRMAFALILPLLAIAADAGPEPDASVPYTGGASDAGADAGREAKPGNDAEPDAGTASGATLSFPRLGATDVVINPALLMRIERAALEPAIYGAPRSASFDGLLLRDPIGNLVAVGPLGAMQPPRHGDRDPRVELSSATLELKPNTRYEVLSRIGICDGTPAPTVCLEDEYHSLGAFETGIVFDHKPPSISSIGEEAVYGDCLAEFSVVASDDLAPPNALRFLVDEQAWLGPRLSLARMGASLQSQHVQVVPVDPSGNRGELASVDLADLRFCGFPPNQGLDDAVGGSAPTTIPAPRPPLPSEPRHDHHGCSLAAPPASATASSFSVLALASLWLSWRRQRRSSS
jgi:hypothetical protein